METLMNHNHMLKSELDRVRSSLSHVRGDKIMSMQTTEFFYTQSQEPSLASTTRLSTIGICSVHCIYLL